MHRAARFLALILVALSGVACGDDGGTGGGGSCADAPTFSEVSAFRVCVSCHSSGNTSDERSGAPASVNFDTHAEASENADRAARQVSQRKMPPEESGLSITNAERAAVSEWARCGAPE